MEQAPNSQDVGSGAVQEGESVADTSDWYSGWSRNTPNNWCEEEKSNLKHDTCGAGEKVEKQEGWVEEQKGGAEDTCSRGAERGHRRRAATTRARPDRRGRWRRNSRVGRCREMASTARLGVRTYWRGSMGRR